MSTGVKFPIAPAIAPVELGNEGQPTIVRCVQVSCEFRDLIFEFIEREFV
jgi:hypothetical protein